jgi:hypothetical protein
MLNFRLFLARSVTPRPNCLATPHPIRASSSCLQQIVYTLAVHREKMHLSALLVRYRCLRLRDLWSLRTRDSDLPWYLRRRATAGG